MQIAICDDSMQFRNEILSNINQCATLNYSKKLVLCSCPSNKDECKAAQGCYC